MAKQIKYSPRFCLTFVVPFLLLSVLACERKSESPRPSSNAQPIIFTTFYPTQYFAQRIAGDIAQVLCPVPPDADALFWTPDSKTIQAMQDADLIVLNGAHLEKWLDTVTLPTERIVDSTRSLRREFIELKATTHSHGPEGKHTHEGTDSHTWLDPNNALTQAEAIHVALVKRFASHAPTFARNFESLANDLRNLDTRFRSLGKPSSTLLASHPAYNYLARRYGWRVVNFDLDPEVVPDATVLAEISRVKEAEQARFLLWEAAPAPAVEQAFEGIGLIHIEFSPVELLDPAAPAGHDYLDLMGENLHRLEPAFK
jgi:zinc transport system substrate-binding protein